MKRLGGRLRRVETASGISEGTVRALDTAGVTHEVTETGASEAVHGTETVH
jgi:hypothetical protein